MSVPPRPAGPGRPPGQDPARAAVELRGVSKHYGTGSDKPVAAADDVSLAIGAGGLIALTGASGSGKSTLLPPQATIVSSRLIRFGGGCRPSSARAARARSTTVSAAPRRPSTSSAAAARRYLASS